MSLRPTAFSGGVKSIPSSSVFVRAGAKKYIARRKAKPSSTPPRKGVQPHPHPRDRRRAGAFLLLGLAGAGWGGGVATGRGGGGAAGRGDGGVIGCVVAQGSFDEKVCLDFMINRIQLTTV